MPREFWQKESLIWVYQDSNPSSCQCQVNAQPFNPFMFRDNSYKYRIILSLPTFNYIVKIMQN